ncbi:hypothetical protein GGR58DRAFT_491877 [Xylaria digitata]|nr:hypothetical protein GGR58DRAFT_491877 [Xylaria digitata]
MDPSAGGNNTDTQSCTIDPDGDVIITLRNFDALSTTLEGAERRNRRKHIPELESQPETEPETAQAEVQLDVLDAPSVEPDEPSVVEESSAFYSMLPTWVEPPPPPPIEESVETSIDIKPTADFSVEFSERTVQLRVSSAHLRLGSLYFKKVLDGPFKESQLASDSLRHVSAEGWDVEAFLIVMRIMHGQNRFVPKSLDLEMLANVAAIVDYYQCREMLEAFAELWRLQMEKHPLPSTIGIDLIRLILVSGVFRWPDEFKAVTEIAQNQSTGTLDTLGLPIPESIIVAIDLQRCHFIGQLASVFDGMLERFYIEPPECSFDCASMRLGALMLQLRHNKKLGFHARVDKSFQGYSVASSIEAARSIKSPSTNRRIYYSCPLRDVIEEKMALLGMKGLDLKDFIPDTQRHRKDETMNSARDYSRANVLK